MVTTTTDARHYFLLLIRFFFGIWFLYAGLMKWLVFGPEGFIGFITSEFDKTWSPHVLNVLLAWLIIIAEPILALWILSGIRARLAWTATSFLMFLLVMGQSILMKPEVIANWEYLVLTVVCAALSPLPAHTESAPITG